MTLTDINISITCSLKCIIAFTAKLMPSFTAYYTMAEPREGFKIQRTFPFPSASKKWDSLCCIHPPPNPHQPAIKSYVTKYIVSLQPSPNKPILTQQFSLFVFYRLLLFRGQCHLVKLHRYMVRFLNSGSNHLFSNIT